jgi:hypothetical protein
LEQLESYAFALRDAINFGGNRRLKKKASGATAGRLLHATGKTHY